MQSKEKSNLTQFKPQVKPRILRYLNEAETCFFPAVW